MEQPIDIRRVSDAVFVTRCKNCVYKDVTRVGFLYCRKLSGSEFFFVSPDWFCKSGTSVRRNAQEGNQDDKGI